MRLTRRNRRAGRAKAPRIAISQAEITADLLYPGHRRPAARETAAARRAGR